MAPRVKRGPIPPGTHHGKMQVSPRVGTVTVDDGSMIVTEAQLRKFGNGDVMAGRRELRLFLENDSDAELKAGPTELPKSIRIAGPADEPAVLELWLHELRANAEHIAPISEEKVLENIRVGTRRRGGIVAVIDGPDALPVAMVVLHPMEWHWSHGRFYQELGAYVHPDHRRSHHADDLMQFSKWAAESMGKSLGTHFYWLGGVLGAWRIRAKIALYRRKFPQMGAAFMWPPPPRIGN